MKFIKTWKGEGGEFEYEPATIDEIAVWLSEGYEVYLDEALTKSARDMDFGWLTITLDYIEACEDDDVLFMPDLWDVVDSYDKTTNVFEEPIPLTAEGRAFAKEWQDYASMGYDLCSGKCKGLAGRYGIREMWNMIQKDELYHKNKD